MARINFISAVYILKNAASEREIRKNKIKMNKIEGGGA